MNIIMYDITPTEKNEATSDVSMLDDQYKLYTAAITRLGGQLGVDNIYDTQTPDDIFRQIMHKKDISAEITADLPFPPRISLRKILSCWELLAVFLLPHLVKKKSYKSFHICDDIGPILLPKIFESLKSDWSWLATRGPNNISSTRGAEYIDGVDGTCDLTATNMRAWKNKITINLKKIDIIMGMTNELTNAINFTISNLAAGGIAMLHISKISSENATMIYLFARCFEHSCIIHTSASDELFLCGSNCIAVSSRPKIENTAPIQLYADINEKIQSYRIHFYEKMNNAYKTLTHTASAKIFPGYRIEYLKDEFPGELHAWAKRTGFNYPLS